MSLALRAIERDEAVIDVGGRSFVADASGALWCGRTATLAVSDLHLEKGSAAAARGTLLPPYDTAETLSLLARVVARFRPRRVVCLGDSFHDSRALDRIAAADRTRIIDLQQGRDWLWIAGNHDEKLAGLLPGDHADALVEEGLSFVHIPRAKPSSAEIAGHLHPCVKVRTRAQCPRSRDPVAVSCRILGSGARPRPHLRDRPRPVPAGLTARFRNRAGRPRRGPAECCARRARTARPRSSRP
jgi:DNA ligase-associated metallophosphoesterase